MSRSANCHMWRQRTQCWRYMTCHQGDLNSEASLVWNEHEVGTVMKDKSAALCEKITNMGQTYVYRSESFIMPTDYVCPWCKGGGPLDNLSHHRRPSNISRAHWFRNRFDSDIVVYWKWYCSILEVRCGWSDEQVSFSGRLGFSCVCVTCNWFRKPVIW